MSDHVVNDCPKGGTHVFPSNGTSACVKCGGQRFVTIDRPIALVVHDALNIDGARLRELLVEAGWVPPAEQASVDQVGPSMRMTYRPKQGVANPTNGVTTFYGPGGHTTQTMYEHEARAIALAFGIEIEELS